MSEESGNKMGFLDYIRDFSDSLIKLDEKVGFKRLFAYLLIILLLIGLFNFKTIIRETIEIFNEISEQIHSEKMEKRDELLLELQPILQEYRVSVSADRILYFEFHNTKENLVGIPFKYVDIVLQNLRYGISGVPENIYRDINVGAITNLYEVIKMGEIVFCSGPEDEYFKNQYPGVYELFNSGDGSKRQAYISIPGVRQPVGMIVLEWMDESQMVDEREIAEQTYSGSASYISRINGLIMSKSTK